MSQRHTSIQLKKRISGPPCFPFVLLDAWLERLLHHIDRVWGIYLSEKLKAKMHLSLSLSLTPEAKLHGWVQSISKLHLERHAPDKNGFSKGISCTWQNGLTLNLYYTTLLHCVTFWYMLPLPPTTSTSGIPHLCFSPLRENWSCCSESQIICLCCFLSHRLSKASGICAQEDHCARPIPQIAMQLQLFVVFTITVLICVVVVPFHWVGLIFLGSHSLLTVSLSQTTFEPGNQPHHFILQCPLSVCLCTFFDQYQ